ncbi:amidohydrolase family protein [Rhodococcus oxybenzonivorans]|uniref:amidohydrolase family protein n=1 Tax=Rhodococcus oxybenzonivorans TaxID=1990687 RepID=UPI00295356EF|nr:amidohydrolase family protein [Rhodococcus oxybenzonivorans]MDV7353749.1 amidohydrolase family protein [Rhodococcus oxybenzonivorans]
MSGDRRLISMLDVHTHFFPRDLPPPSSGAIAEGWPVVVDKGHHVEIYQRDKLVRILNSSAWDPAVRLEDMDRAGVEAQVVMPTPFTFLYDADPDIAIHYAQAQNNALADLVAEGRGRFYGLGTLPLQDPASAATEARRVRTTLGMQGVEIGTHAHRYLLHDPELDPVFRTLDDLDAAVFVHPWQPVEPRRSSHNGLAFGLGRPVETELAVGSLVFGGVLDRHPGLRICLAHGGAGVPALRGRLHNGWQRQPAQSRTPTEDPRSVVKRFWVDGLTYDPDVLALAEDTFGPDHLVVGSDYPFAAQERPIGAAFAAAAAHGSLQLGSGWRDRTTRNAFTFLGTANATGNAGPLRQSHITSNGARK